MDIQEFRDTGHRIVDRLADYLESIEDRRISPDVDPARLAELFSDPLPTGPSPAATVLDELDRKLLPYCAHVNHPGYFGLITPTPNPMGILGDFIASALNQNCGTYTLGPSAIAMERQTVRWLTDMAGYDENGGGNLTSGGTTANFIGLKLARDWASGDRIQHAGFEDGRWAVYTSEERHVAVDKAVDAVGVGRRNMRILPTDDEYRIRLDALEQAIARDKDAGIRPMCIVAITGTTNTGAIDPLRALRGIADREGMWLHADAAYGGGMLLSQKWPGLLDDLKLADSITIDPHKWFYAPLDAGAVLVRDEARLTASYGIRPPYLTDELDSGHRYQYFVHGFEQSRRFRSLKVWMSFKRYGAAEIGRWIDGNVEQAGRLHELVEQRDDFHTAMRPPMSAICIRYDPGDLPQDRLGPIHHEVVRRIERDGRFWFSTTFMKGRWWFRINPVNFRTRLEHMDELMDVLARECAQASAGVA